MTVPLTEVASPRYDEAYFAANYRNYARQNPPRKLRFYRHLVEAALAPGAPRSIHDLGCGMGLFLAKLGDSWRRFGSDVSEFALEKARAACPDATFAQGSAADASPFGEWFGVVTAFDVIEHVPNLDAVAQCVTNQLHEHGAFVFVVPTYDGLSGPVIRRLDRDPTHVHKWPRDRWLAWASEHFEVIDWLGIIRWLTPLGYYVHTVTRRLRRHTPAILVTCRKRGGSC